MIPPADARNTRRNNALRDLIGYSLALLALLFWLGSCATVSVNCWRHGGHVVKNIFDWPTCLEARP